MISAVAVPYGLKAGSSKQISSRHLRKGESGVIPPKYQTPNLSSASLSISDFSINDIYSHTKLTSSSSGSAPNPTKDAPQSQNPLAPSTPNATKGNVSKLRLLLRHHTTCQYPKLVTLVAKKPENHSCPSPPSARSWERYPSTNGDRRLHSRRVI